MDPTGRSSADNDRPPPANAIRAVNARSLKLLIAGVCVAGFAIPWIVLTALQRTNPTTPQQVVVPAGSKVTVLKSSIGASAGVSVVTGPATSTGTTTTTTRASVPPP